MSPNERLPASASAAADNACSISLSKAVTTRVLCICTPSHSKKEK